MKNFKKLSLKAKTVVLCVLILLAGAAYFYANGKLAALTGGEDSTCQKAVTKWESENAYLTEAKTLFAGVAAPVNFASSRFPEAKGFKTEIIKAINDGPDLAGKYAVAQWACGTACQDHAVVNMETGDIVAFGFESEAGVSMSDHYNVLVTNPKQNLPSKADFNKANANSQAYLLNLPREYYILLENGTTTTFKKVCTENPFEGMGI